MVEPPNDGGKPPAQESASLPLEPTQGTGQGESTQALQVAEIVATIACGKGPGDDEADMASAPVKFPEGQWEYHCGVRHRWVRVDPVEDSALKRAFLKSGGTPKYGPYLVNGVPYELDFAFMRRTNLASGRERHARFSGHLPFPPPSKPRPQPVLPMAASPVQPSPQPGPREKSLSPERYFEESDLYTIDDKGDHVLVWLRVESGDLLRRVRSGHVEVNFRPHGLEVRVLEPEQGRTLEYRWARLRQVDPVASSWRASQDGERLVLTLAKHFKGARAWDHLFHDPDMDKQYFRFSVQRFQHPLDILQGCWLIEDGDDDDDREGDGGIGTRQRAKVRVLGDVAFILTPSGVQQHTLGTDSGGLVVTEGGESFRAKVARSGGRVDWDDGEVWIRDRAGDKVVAEGLAEPLPKGDAQTRQDNAAAIDDGTTLRLHLDLRGDGATRHEQQQKELLRMLEDDDDDTDDDPERDGGGNSCETGSAPSTCQGRAVAHAELTSKAPLPSKLLTQVRICCIDVQELIPKAIPMTLSRLQLGQPLTDTTEVVALSSLDLLLRWHSEFVTPSQRVIVAAARTELKSLIAEARLRQTHAADAASAGAVIRGSETRRCPPAWWIFRQKPPLAVVATKLLREELCKLRPSGVAGGKPSEPPLASAFEVARNIVIEQLWAEPQAIRCTRCQRLDTIWARRYSSACIGALERGSVGSTWKEFDEGGLLVFDQSVDWTTLLLARREAESWLEDFADDWGHDCHGSAWVECSSVDLLESGHRCLYACARVCRLSLERAGAALSSRIAGMAPGDGFLTVGRRLDEAINEDASPSAFLSLGAPGAPTTQLNVPLGSPGSSVQRDVVLAGGTLLVCRNAPTFVQDLRNMASEDKLAFLCVHA